MQIKYYCWDTHVPKLGTVQSQQLHLELCLQVWCIGGGRWVRRRQRLSRRLPSSDPAQEVSELLFVPKTQTIQRVFSDFGGFFIFFKASDGISYFVFTSASISSSRFFGGAGGVNSWSATSVAISMATCSSTCVTPASVTASITLTKKWSGICELRLLFSDV